MGLLRKAAALVIALCVLVLATASEQLHAVKRQQSWRVPPSRYCEPGTNLCYAELKNPSGATLRIAVPDGAKAPYDIMYQVSAPLSIGWVGIAWGGAMVNNPLTVSWANGRSAISSSRWTT